MTCLAICAAGCVESRDDGQGTARRAGNADFCGYACDNVEHCESVRDLTYPNATAQEILQDRGACIEYCEDCWSDFGALHCAIAGCNSVYLWTWCPVDADACTPRHGHRHRQRRQLDDSQPRRKENEIASYTYRDRDTRIQRGGCYIDWYADEDGASGRGIKPLEQQWYGTRADCLARLKSGVVPFNGWAQLSGYRDGVDRTDPGYWQDNY